MTIRINFQSLPPDTVVTNQFEREGIIFTSPCDIVQEPETLTHMLMSQKISSVITPPTRVIRARFLTPKHSLLRIGAVFSNAAGEGVHATLRVFDAGGSKLGERVFGSVGPRAWVEFTSPNGDIAGFEVSGRTNRFDCIDEVEFDPPPPGPDFRLVYDGGIAEPLQLCAGTGPEAVVRARVSVYRLHGSHGEILLGVSKPCPGTTYRFDPATVHSGVPHFDLEIRAAPDTPPAYHFNVEVFAVPRTKSAGNHERTVHIPITITAAGSEDAVIGEVEENEETQVKDSA